MYTHNIKVTVLSPAKVVMISVGVESDDLLEEILSGISK